jgi:gamma-glutamylcyclotransferase (GGCT)/AIG2-like uncharacterized protein YtfP
MYEGDLSVQGEVYLVDGETMRRLDQLEGVPHMYRRETMHVAGYGECFFYHWNEKSKGHDVRVKYTHGIAEWV